MLCKTAENPKLLLSKSRQSGTCEEKAGAYALAASIAFSSPKRVHKSAISLL